MKRLMSAALAVSALAMTPALSAAEVEIEAEGPVIELTISESVLSEPDFATIYAGVETEAPTASEAMRQNAVQMRQVIDRIKALNIPEEDIQTASVSLRARYSYDSETRRRTFQGYAASNSLSIKMTDTENLGSTLGSTLDALVSAGANSIDGPSFGLDDTDAPKDEAREKALARAMARAEAYAKSLGYEGVEVLEISESIRGSSTRALFESAEFAALAAADIDMSTPIQVGRVSTDVRLLIKYEAVSDDESEGGSEE